jgi:hypothetical protein
VFGDLAARLVAGDGRVALKRIEGALRLVARLDDDDDLVGDDYSPPSGGLPRALTASMRSSVASSSSRADGKQ